MMNLQQLDARPAVPSALSNAAGRVFPLLNAEGVPIIPVRIGVLWQIGQTVGSMFPESGGPLGGPEGEFAVTRFHFDSAGSTSAATYEPDVPTLNALFSGAWDRDTPKTMFIGCVHSHPPGACELSGPDKQYIGRLFRINPHLGAFFAPLVLPDSKRLIPWVVYRERPWEPVLARIELI